MDYGTFFFTNIVSVTVFALTLSGLAWRNRSIVGLNWLAGGLVVGLVKLALQGLEGRVSPVLSGMLANELYLVSFTLQFLGLRWFVARRSVHRKWPFALIPLALLAYTAFFLLRIGHSGDILNLPFVAVCGVSGWFLLRYGRGPFVAVSRVSAAVLFGDMLIAGYRAVLTEICYSRPWATVDAHKDPRWLYSLAAMAFLAACLVMCDLWFVVAELKRELAEQASTDPLTGALNRRAMGKAVLRETARSVRYGSPLCMVVLDIDHFKRINDAYGHAAGDRVLQAFVLEVRKMLRTNDVLARTGGEEFTLLLPNTPAVAAVVAAERVRQAIEALEVLFEGHPLRFTVSAGVAQLDSSESGWEGMMRRADAAMYQAKENGRNSVRPHVDMLQLALTFAC